MTKTKMCKSCQSHKYMRPEFLGCQSMGLALGTLAIGAMLHWLGPRPPSVDKLTMFNVHLEDKLVFGWKETGYNSGIDLEYDYLFYTDCPNDRIKELVRETFLEGLTHRRMGTPDEAVRDRFREAEWYCVLVKNRLPMELSFDVEEIEEVWKQ